jgi:hypothetical protein
MSWIHKITYSGYRYAKSLKRRILLDVSLLEDFFLMMWYLESSTCSTFVKKIIERMFQFPDFPRVCRNVVHLFVSQREMECNRS